MSFFENLFGNNIKQQPRKDRVNVVARYESLIDGEFYIMILDYKTDKVLIDKIMQKKFSKSAIKAEFIKRGNKINGSLIEYMQKLIPSLNKEDLRLSVDVDMDDPYEIDFGFFFN